MSLVWGSNGFKNNSNFSMCWIDSDLVDIKAYSIFFTEDWQMAPKAHGRMASISIAYYHFEALLQVPLSVQ